MIRYRHPYTFVTAAALLAAGLLLVVATPASAGKYTERYAQVSSKLVAQGRMALDKADFEAAAKLLEQAVVANPKNALAYTYLGQTQAKLGKPQLARKYYTTALDIDPDQTLALALAGQSDLEASDLKSAEAKLQRLSRLCGPACTEYRQLSSAVSTYKTSKPNR